MASTHRTILTGDALTADYLNPLLNPSTADHIPYAMAAGTATATITTGGAIDVVVTYPAGRFSSTPIVTACPAMTHAGTIGSTVLVHTQSSTGFFIRFQQPSNVAGNFAIAWIAVQMTK